MSFVQKLASLNASNGVTTQTTTLTGVTAGNLLVVVSTWDINQASAAPTIDSTSVTAGWQLASQAGPVTSAAHAPWVTGASIYYLQNAPAGSNSLKLNFPASARVETGIAEYSGYATSAPLDKTATNTVTAAATITATTAATSQANELVIAVMGCNFAIGNSNTGVTNPPTGFTSLYVQQDSNTYCASEMAYKEVTSTGTQSATWSWTGANEGAAAIATFGTTGTPAAVLSSPTPSGTLATATSANVGATTDTGSGTMYTVVDTASLTGITGPQIAAGKNASGATAVSSGNLAISSTGAKSMTDSGLTASTTYNAATVQQTSAGYSNIVFTSFTTHAPAPNITGTSSATPQHGSTLTITGTNFGSTQGTGGVTLGGVAQTVTSWSSTSIQITVDRGTNKYGVTEGIVVTDGTGGISNTFNVTSLQPPTGWQYIDIGTPNTTAANRLTATGGGDLASGDQVEWGNVFGTGSVTVFADGTFVFDTGVTSFDSDAWTSAGGWGSVATELTSSGNSITSSQTLPSVSQTATTKVLLTATAGQSVAPVSQTSSAAVLVTATVNQTLAAPAQIANISGANQVQVAQVLSAPVQNATVSIKVSATVTQALLLPQLTAQIVNGAAPIPTSVLPPVHQWARMAQVFPMTRETPAARTYRVVG